MTLFVILALLAGVALVASGAKADEAAATPAVKEEVAKIVETKDPGKIAEAAQVMAPTNPAIAAELERIAQELSRRVLTPQPAPPAPSASATPAIEDLTDKSPGFVPAVPPFVSTTSPKPIDQAPPRDGTMPAELQKSIETALASINDPDALERLAKELEAKGFRTSAEAMMAKAAVIRAAQEAARAAKQIEDEVLKPAEAGAPPAPPAALPPLIPPTIALPPVTVTAEPVKAAVVATSELLQTHLSSAGPQGKPVKKGQEDKSLVRKFQEQAGAAKPDGLYGPVTRVLMAQKGGNPNPFPSLYIPSTKNPRAWVAEKLDPFMTDPDPHVRMVAGFEKAKVLEAFGIR